MDYDWRYGPAEICHTDLLRDVVQQVMWQCVARAPDGSVWKNSGSVAVPAPDPDTFVPFDSITAQTVQDWVTAGLDTTAVQAQLYGEYANRGNDQTVKQFNY